MLDGAMSRRGRPKHPDILTPREWEVLGHIREGRSNEQIAERLGISIDGVKYHVSGILGKLALDNRHDAARWAEGQSPRPWPAGALAPLLFWRKLKFGWLSPVMAGGLLVLIAAGIGVLIWGLLATRGGDEAGSASKTEAAAPTVAYLIEQVGDPAQYEDLRAVLRAIDAGTGRAIPGYPDYDLGHHAVGALSPDGANVAIAASPRSGSRERLMIFDVDRWEPLENIIFKDNIRWLQWSPNGNKLYVTDRNCCQISVYVVDMEGGDTEQFNIPLSMNSVHLSPDGSTLYVFGTRNSDWRVDPADEAFEDIISPVLLAVDSSTGEVRDELAVRDVVIARATEISSDGYPWYNERYFVGSAMSPDGRSFYVAHADSDRITVIDLATMRVGRTAEIDGGASLFFIGTPYVNIGGPSGSRSVTISADGQYLYVSGSRFIKDHDGEVVHVDLGVRVIDTRTFTEVSRIQEKGMPRLRVDPAGRYLYRFGDGFSILDAISFEVLAHWPMEWGSDILIGQAAGGSLTPPQ